MRLGTSLAAKISLLKELCIWNWIAFYKYSAPGGASEPVTTLQTTESLPRIAEAIARGGVIAFRTVTFYGLGADPFNRRALERIKQLKGRDASKPILVVISDIDQIERFVSERSRAFDLLAERFWPGALTLIGLAAQKLMNHFWPGPLTLVLPARKGLPRPLLSREGKIGVRISSHPVAKQLPQALGRPVTATSANPSGEKPARTAEEVAGYFGATVDLIVDGGEAPADRPSTVVDVRAAKPKLIREGAILWSLIQKSGLN